MQIQQCLRQSVSQLDEAGIGDSSRIDAEILLCHVIGKSRSFLFSHADEQLSAEQARQFNNLLQRRLAGEPVAYIIGHREFWSLSFRVSPDVLIPRPDTECLVEKILHLDLPDNACVIDLGVGSGAITIALASERKSWHCTGVDLSAAALQVADSNRKLLLTRNNCSLVRGDWMTALAPKSVDLVVANPPYIESTDQHLSEGDVRFEPLSALVSDDSGLQDIRSISQQARAVLVAGGYLVIEHGWRQQQQVIEILLGDGYVDIEAGMDLAGQPRFVLARFSVES